MLVCLKKAAEVSGWRRMLTNGGATAAAGSARTDGISAGGAASSSEPFGTATRLKECVVCQKDPMEACF